jgi:hypothetical protein
LPEDRQIDQFPCTYFGATYDRVQDGAGFKLKPIGNSGESNFEGNKRVIYVDPVSVTGLEGDRKTNHFLNAYATTVLNELMHQAKSSGLYSDPTLARAIFNLLTPEERREHPLPQTDDITTNSKYFHPLFNDKCFAPR